jgi:HD-like signal output (HDOD) protein
MTMLSAPLESVDAYVRFLSREPLPVLRQTVRELAALRDEQASVNGKRLAAVVLGDPLMTLKLLAHLQAHRARSQNHDITTIDRAIMMLGITPFFDSFADMPTVEDRLTGKPKALLGALQVIARARKAAHFARDWAILRHDLDVEEITVAALLHETIEIMCWIFAPELAQRVRKLQMADRRLRSAVAQRVVFGVTERDILLAMARAWQLPELLVTLLDERNADNPRVRTVRLATRFARHVANGWDNPALPDDIAEIEALVHMNGEALLRRLGMPNEAMARFLPGED